MTPFIEKQFEECIEIFRKAMITKEYDSVNTVNISQHFTWEDNKPINYNYDNEVPSFGAQVNNNGVPSFSGSSNNNG